MAMNTTTNGKQTDSTELRDEQLDAVSGGDKTAQSKPTGGNKPVEFIVIKLDQVFVTSYN
jgi:hypothetical protein